MGWADLETFEGRPGINLTTKKMQHRLWIPLTEPMQASLATWEKRPGPFLVDENGVLIRDLARTTLPNKWLRERTNNPDLAPLRELTMHGLRATAVVRLRRAGAEITQIADCVGMSEQMVKHYCRLFNQKENDLAAVVHFDRLEEERNRPKRGK